MKETKIDSTKINEVYNEVAFEPQIVCIDANDVRRILTGKSGAMYQKTKDEGESISDFMTTFLEELKTREQVRESTHCLVHLRFAETDELTMDHMNLIHEFFESFGKDKNILWGMGKSKGKSQMTMTILCTKEDNSKVKQAASCICPFGSR